MTTRITRSHPALAAILRLIARLVVRTRAPRAPDAHLPDSLRRDVGLPPAIPRSPPERLPPFL